MALRVRVCAAAAALTIGALAATAAVAGPPYVTDDPEPTDLGKWEVYGFSSGTFFRHASEGEGGFDINYGGAENLQLTAVVSLDTNHEAGESSHVGIADTELGVKYRFLRQHEGSWLPDVAFFPKIDLPTAGERFGSGKLGAILPLWAQKDFGPWSLFGGGGWTLNPGAGNRDYGFAGIALTRRVTERLSLGGEVYHQAASAVGGRSSTGLGFGASWQVAPKWSLIGSAGPLIAHRASAGTHAFYLALQFHN